MATAGLSYEELQLRKKLLLEELQGTANELLNRNEVQGAIDIHHPERSPGWKPYRHQEYPKMLYHPTKLDRATEEKRLNVRRRNEANPNLAPLDLPAQEAHRIIVQTKAEDEKAQAQGFVTKPPQLLTDEDKRYLRDPLAESMGVVPAPASLPIASLTPKEILELNAMSKNDLAEHAKEVYGVELPEQATKIDYLNAISAAPKKEAIHV